MSCDQLCTVGYTLYCVVNLAEFTMLLYLVLIITAIAGKLFEMIGCHLSNS